MGHAMREFCVQGDARALVKQLDKSRHPQHAVATVLARKGWLDAAAVMSEVDRSYIVLAVNTLQAHISLLHHVVSFSRFIPPFFLSLRAFNTTASLPTACPSASKSSPFRLPLLSHVSVSFLRSLVQVRSDDLVRLADGTVGPVSADAQQYSLADVLLPLVGSKTILPAYAVSFFTSDPPDAAMAALASPTSDSDVNVSSATKKAIAQPGS
jgi:hypothetical protein